MMMEKKSKLPEIKGSYGFDVPLAPLTTLKIGGAAEIFLYPQDFVDLATFLRHKPQDIALTLIGEGSNILVRDGGIEGTVCHLGRGFDCVELQNDVIRAEAGATGGKVARKAREAGLSGAEFLCGIPGSVGGALAMNAGAYGKETADLLEKVDVITDTGDCLTLHPQDVGFGYRRSNLPEGWVFRAGYFRLKAGDKAQIREEMRKINRERSASQPLNLLSSGSWFKNPPGRKAWQVTEEAGCRGMRVGQAQVSEKHSNFFVNLGGATAAQMEELSWQVEQKVKEKTGIQLEREVRIIGRKKQEATS